MLSKIEKLRERMHQEEARKAPKPPVVKTLVKPRPVKPRGTTRARSVRPEADTHGVHSEVDARRGSESIDGRHNGHVVRHRHTDADAPPVCPAQRHDVRPTRVVDRLNLDILVPTDRITADRPLLEGNGFTWAGTYQTNIDNHAVVFIRFRTCVRTSGDGVATYGNTTLLPTDMERQAIERMRQEMSMPIDEARLRALQEGRSYDDGGKRL